MAKDFGQLVQGASSCMLPLALIKDTLKEETSLYKGQAESTLVYTFYRKSPLKEDNLSIYTKDKMAGHGPKGVLIKRFHYSIVQ